MFLNLHVHVHIHTCICMYLLYRLLCSTSKIVKTYNTVTIITYNKPFNLIKY